MLIRPATMADVRHIGQTLWERGIVELDALGVNPADWLDGWKCRINRGDAVAIEAHAILGWDWESPDICNTSFQASKSFEQHGVGLAVTKVMRRALPGLMKSAGAVESHTYSLCIDPQAPKWFRLLGLEEDLEFPGHLFMRGPYKMRRFIRRA